MLLSPLSKSRSSMTAKAADAISPTCHSSHPQARPPQCELPAHAPRHAMTNDTLSKALPKHYKHVMQLRDLVAKCCDASLGHAAAPMH